MKRIFYYILKAAVLVCWFIFLSFVYTFVLIATNGTEDSDVSTMLVAMFLAIMSIVLFRYYRSKKNQNRASPDEQTEITFEPVNSTKTSYVKNIVENTFLNVSGLPLDVKNKAIKALVKKLKESDIYFSKEEKADIQKLLEPYEWRWNEWDYWRQKFPSIGNPTILMSNNDVDASCDGSTLEQRNHILGMLMDTLAERSRVERERLENKEQGVSTLTNTVYEEERYAYNKAVCDSNKPFKVYEPCFPLNVVTKANIQL